MSRNNAISAEITSQMLELKLQLNKEIVEDLQVMKTQIMEEVDAKINLAVSAAVATAITNVKRELVTVANTAGSNAAKTTLDSLNKQIVVSDQNRAKMTMELVAAVSDKLSEDIYNTVMEDINTNIAPKVNQVMSWVNYNMQDGNEIVDQYRRAADKQSNDSTKLLTYGKTDKRIITPHIRTVFGNDSSSED